MATTTNKDKPAIEVTKNQPRTASPTAVTMRDPAYLEQERKRHAQMRIAQTATQLDQEAAVDTKDADSATSKTKTGPDTINGTHELDQDMAISVINRMTDTDAILKATSEDERPAIQSAVTRRLSEIAAL